MAQSAEHDASHHPLAGVVLCCTSIAHEQRSGLISVGAQMGAEHRFDLTADVTHLIVGDIDTPKYKYVAKERPDIVPVLPEWVEAVRASWMEGGETRVDELERRHRLPTFYRLRVCITGFADLDFRKQIEHAVTRHGGEYHGDLKRDVTHLIAAAPDGIKYTYGRSWGLHVVGIEWLQQSLDRGMVLDERLYDPEIEPSARGRGAWTRAAAPPNPRKRPGGELQRAGSNRKLRRTASAKFDVQTDGMWNDIVRAESQAEAAKPSEWDDGSEQVAEIRLEPESEGTNAGIKEDKKADWGPSKLRRKQSRGMFEGRRFWLHGFDERETSVLEKHLRSHNAEIASDLAQLSQSGSSEMAPSTFIVIPSKTQAIDVPATPDLSSTLVNEMWIEKCLECRKYVDPTTNVLHKPFLFPIRDFAALQISSTAFENIELLHVGKAVKLLGAKYEGTLTKNVSVLVCNTTNVNREKIRHAIKWNIPSVSAKWLWDCVRHNEKKPFDNYLLHPVRQAEPSSREQLGRDPDPDGTDRSKQPRGSMGGPRPPADTRRSSSQRTPSAGNSRSPSYASAPQEPPTGDGVESAPRASTTANKSFAASTACAPTPSTRPSPLKEVSPNISPRPSPPKPQSSTSLSASGKPAPSVLHEAISSLLVHHAAHASSATSASNSRPSSRQKTAGDQVSAVPNDPATGTGPARRKRRLLGRAVSNLSMQSNGDLGSGASAGPSPAKSVASANTDGLGTPIELPVVRDMKRRDSAARASAEAQPGKTAGEQAFMMSDEPSQMLVQAPALTQVGYEDEEASHWRMSLLRKVGASGLLDDESGREDDDDKTSKMEPTEKRAKVMRDVDGTESIARRTRRAGKA